MSDPRSGGGDSASDLFDAWMAHRGAPGEPDETEDHAMPTLLAEPAGEVLATLVPPAPEAPAPPVSEPLSARLRAFRGEPDAVEPERPEADPVDSVPERTASATLHRAETDVTDPTVLETPWVAVPEPTPPAAPAPETTWRGYVLPSITPADLAAAEPTPVDEPVVLEPEPALPEPFTPEPEPVAWEPEPAEVPEPDPAPQPVAAEPEPEQEPEPVPAETDPVAWDLVPEPVAVMAAADEPVASAPLRYEPEPEPAVVEEPAAREAPLGITAALAAAAAKAEHQSRQPRSAAPLPVPVPVPVPREREPIFAATTKPEPPPKPDEMPAVTEFTPREGNRTIAGLLLVAALVAAAMAGYLAWYERSAATIGIGCTLFLLVLVIWATRASSAPAHLKINSGHLTVQRTGTIRHFDLASKYTALEVHGRPGLPGWKVLIEQRDATPYVIDASMVNPRAFMKVLRYYRPEL